MLIRKQFSIAGSSFHAGAAGYIGRLQPKHPLSIVREPTNKYDPNAVAVMWGRAMLGYVPRGLAAQLAPLIDKGVEFKCAKAPNVMWGVCVLTYDDGLPDPAA